MSEERALKRNSNVHNRPTLVFDGDCGFCRMWVAFARMLTGERVEYAPYQSRAERFPEVPTEDFRQAVQFFPVDYPDGEGRSSGAAAAFRVLALAPGYGWFLWLYRHLPGFAFIAEFFYRQVAKHRDGAFRITRAFWGKQVVPPSYQRASEYFTRALSFIYLIAFASFGMQVRGLIGSEGILPVNIFLQIARSQLGPAAMWRIPSVFWWTHGDFALLSIAWGGVALAAASILAKPHSVWQRTIYIILFVYYLSIVSAGQIFMSYQWDFLLLETGFLAIFLRPTWPRLWLFRWLLFRLMFESGAVKLLSGDPTWHGLTALSVHFETQPLPTIVAWYAHQLPAGILKFCTAMVLLVELVLPFLMFGTRRLKQIAAFGTLGLQLLIFITGNYTFFNVLTMALCLFLFDDAFFARGRYVPPAPYPRTPVIRHRIVSVALMAVILTLSGTTLLQMFRTAPAALNRVVQTVAPYGIVSQYGLFASMTTTRPEVEVEGSNDGQTWLPYIFRYKAGPLNRAPGWIAPFQPRLDWQMWFAALGNYRQNPWFLRFMVSILQGSQPVMALLERDPFNGTPPRQIRAMVYRYHFTTFSERSRTGGWWKRETLGAYFPPVGLRGPNAQ